MFSTTSRHHHQFIIESFQESNLTHFHRIGTPNPRARTPRQASAACVTTYSRYPTATAARRPRRGSISWNRRSAGGGTVKPPPQQNQKKDVAKFFFSFAHSHSPSLSSTSSPSFLPSRPVSSTPTKREAVLPLPDLQLAPRESSEFPHPLATVRAARGLRSGAATPPPPQFPRRGRAFLPWRSLLAWLSLSLSPLPRDRRRGRGGAERGRIALPGSRRGNLGFRRCRPRRRAGVPACVAGVCPRSRGIRTLACPGGRPLAAAAEAWTWTRAWRRSQTPTLTRRPRPPAPEARGQGARPRRRPRRRRPGHPGRPRRPRIRPLSGWRGRGRRPGTRWWTRWSRRRRTGQAAGAGTRSRRYQPSGRKAHRGTSDRGWSCSAGPQHSRGTLPRHPLLPGARGSVCLYLMAFAFWWFLEC
jgi:hypothetical protein